MKNIVMLDCETLALSSRAVILQIGAVVVDLEDHAYKIRESYDRHISKESSIAYKREVEQGTVQFWEKQPEAVRKSVMEPEHLDSFPTAISDFFHWITQVNNKYGMPEIYANGVMADITWLESAMRDLDLRIPWMYNKIRDFRTVNKLFPMKWDKPGKNEQCMKHNALYDSFIQARQLHKIYWCHVKCHNTRRVTKKGAIQQLGTASNYLI